MRGVITFYSCVNIVRDAFVTTVLHENSEFKSHVSLWYHATGHCISTLCFGYLTSGLNFVCIVCCLLFECVSVFVYVWLRLILVGALSRLVLVMYCDVQALT